MKVRIGFLGWQNIYQLFNFDIVNFLLKTNDGRDKRTNLILVWIASYASAKTLEREGRI